MLCESVLFEGQAKDSVQVLQVKLGPRKDGPMTDAASIQPYFFHATLVLMQVVNFFNQKGLYIDLGQSLM
jgi:hypothetical protein